MSLSRTSVHWNTHGVEIDDPPKVVPLLDKLPLDLEQRIYKKQLLADGDLMTDWIALYMEYCSSCGN